MRRVGFCKTFGDINQAAKAYIINLASQFEKPLKQRAAALVCVILGNIRHDDGIGGWGDIAKL